MAYIRRRSDSLLFEEAHMSICLVVARISFVNTYPDRLIFTKNAVNFIGITQQEWVLAGMESSQAVTNHSTGRRSETGLG
ncbi:hypothetical protein DSCW_32930 [Desulfosarcina widdelii]|uniref:Uncharacterized protein n=1 Tax=Desulfosarcina widdelii TaxID=947919 RepID=A0A5K7Z2F8_9BACT|nr:hypothetical protein DSCW_32930 [Desulfosarcina widdelii]